jgi:ubiquinone/menaquinone biosynthesis C-methylase UbiE
MELDFMSEAHNSSKRDYLQRVNDKDFPKYKAAELAKKWGFDYWDGDRRINYGGYKYIEGRWEKIARKIINHYKLKPGDKVLDIGCGKGFLLYDILKLQPAIEVYGIDISQYAISNCKTEIKDNLTLGSASKLPYENNFFDLVISINTLHNLYTYELELALQEIERVGKKNKYICVESYKTETQKMNLLYWQVTCESFYTPTEWLWWFKKSKYSGDFSFIYFN